MTVSLNTIEVQSVAKSFGAIQAIDDVSFAIRRGEVVAVVGDNGAGKSTLVKILAGVCRPDRGRLLIDGFPVVFSGPREAREAGIEAVYQDLALVDTMRVAQNVFLGREPRRAGLLGSLGRMLDFKRMTHETEKLLAELQIRVPGLSSKPVRRMSGGQRQGVAIARGVYWGSRLLILDEPTAALGAIQTAEVEELIRRTRETGLSIIVISHNLEQVFRVADRIIVLRLGRKVLDAAINNLTGERVIEFMTGLRG